nr:citrate/2-methylcitrate synthase [Angustibacter aerolatus]
MTHDATLKYDGGEPAARRPGGDRRQRRLGHLEACWAPPATSRSTPASATPRRPAPRSPTSTATRASCATAASRSTRLAEKSTFIEVAYLLIYGALPTATELEDFTNRIRRHTLLHEDLKRFFEGFPATRTRCRCCRRRCRRCRPSTRTASRSVTRTRSSLSTVRLLAAADDRGVRLQEEHRPAVPVPRQLDRAGRELPAADVRLPGRAVRRRPGHDEGARPAVHPARRPRAELLDVDGAAGRLRPGEPVRVGVGRHPRPVRPAARRRELRRPGDARAHPARRRRRRQLHAEGEEQGGRRPAHGLRAPRLQELRPARGDHQEDRRRDPRQPRPARRACSTSRCGWRRSRCRTTTSSSASLYPNVDFYTGLIYKAMGFPTKMFTVLFAIGRLPGWIAQWREMMEDPETKIGRPRRLYVGEPERDYVPVADR